MATFVDIAGVPYPDKYKGKKVLPYEGTSLLPVIMDEAQSRETPLFWQWQNGRAVRDGRWKIVKDGLGTPWSLYDMIADPSETADLSVEHPEVVNRMSALFDQWFDRVSITKPHTDKKKNL